LASTSYFTPNQEGTVAQNMMWADRFPADLPKPCSSVALSGRQGSGLFKACAGFDHGKTIINTPFLRKAFISSAWTDWQIFKRLFPSIIYAPNGTAMYEMVQATNRDRKNEISSR
jgi:hypothetical protein